MQSIVFTHVSKLHLLPGLILFCSTFGSSILHADSFKKTYLEAITTSVPCIRHYISIDWHFNVDQILNDFRDHHSHQKIELDDKILANASGIEDYTWTFTSVDLNNRFYLLFRYISESRKWGFTIELTPNDLFHGHIFLVNQADGPDIAILFHSKEYPNDAEFILQNNGKGENSSFSTSSPGFLHRNFLWINRAKVLLNFDGECIKTEHKELFLPDNFENLSPDLVSLYLKSKTLQTHKMPGYLQPLGDVNVFFDDTTREMQLFFTYTPKTN